MTAPRKMDPWAKAYFRKAQRAHELFNFGWDTAKIAAVMQLTEDRALKYVTVGRCQARGLRLPYKVVP